MRVLTTQRATGHPVPGPASSVPDLSALRAADPLSASSDGVELTRLIGLARLTAAQALEIGAGVLAEAARRSETDPGNAGSDAVGVDPVVIGADGR